MADFQLAVEKTLRHEGGYANDPDDPGGETLFGISRRAHGDSDFFRKFDALRSAGLSPKTIELNDEMRSMAKAIYRKEYWDNDKLQLDYIQNQAVAEQVFDFAVNAGVNVAALMLQKSLNNQFDAGLEEDGWLGSKTRSALNQALSIARSGLIALYQAHRIQYYLSLRNASSFIYTWARRTFD